MMWLHVRCWGCLSRGLCRGSKMRMFCKVKCMCGSKKDLQNFYHTRRKKTVIMYFIVKSLLIKKRPCLNGCLCNSWNGAFAKHQLGWLKRCAVNINKNSERNITLIKTSLMFSKRISSNTTLNPEIPRALVMFYLREEKSSQIPRTSEIAVERRLGWWERLHLIVPSCSLFVCLIFQPLTFLRAVPTKW